MAFSALLLGFRMVFDVILMHNVQNVLRLVFGEAGLKHPVQFYRLAIENIEDGPRAVCFTTHIETVLNHHDLHDQTLCHSNLSHLQSITFGGPALVIHLCELRHLSSISFLKSDMIFSFSVSDDGRGRE